MISTLRLLLKTESVCIRSRILLPNVVAAVRNDYFCCFKISSSNRFLSRRAFCYCNYHPSSGIARNLCIRNSSVLNKDKNINENPDKPNQVEVDLFGLDSKLTLFQKFKLMYKKYWYVLIPVHIITSVGWITGFYYMSKSGMDLSSLLQYLHLSETYIKKAQSSDMAHYAIAYICYKVITPVRYAVSLGGTTVLIKYLAQAGYIKPVPTSKELVKMYQDKKKSTRAKMKEDTKEAN